MPARITTHSPTTRILKTSLLRSSNGDAAVSTRQLVAWPHPRTRPTERTHPSRCQTPREQRRPEAAMQAKPCFLTDEPHPPSHTKGIGGARRDRTDDLLLAKQALSQLSYGPAKRKMVGLGRLELPTSRLSSARSNQLSYKPLIQRPGRNRAAQVRPGRKRNVGGGIPHMPADCRLVFQEIRYERDRRADIS